MKEKRSEIFDVVVVGGGMAGVMAAMSAASPGLRVLIVEPSNVLGGQGTAGGVAGFCGDTSKVNHLFDELVARLARHNLIDPLNPLADRRDYDLEWCAFFLQEMVVARGIEVLLHSRIIEAQAENGGVNGLTVATAGEVIKIKPRFVVDCSGRCVVPWLTGFPVVHEGANKQLPMSLYFTMWDTGREVTPILPEGCPKWSNDDEIPMTSLHRFPSGKTEIKMKVVGFDAVDGWSLSQAEMFARRHMHGLIHYLQTIGYRGIRLHTSVLASVSRHIGIREERRIVGEHVLTEEEVRKATIFPDAVAVCNYHLDYHWPDRMQRGSLGHTDMLDPHHLPLRMMIPKGAKNMLVAGRGASGDQMAMSAFRVMVPVAQMGFAAGLAASQCLESDTDLTCIDIPALQEKIVAGGQSLNLSDYGGYLRQKLLTREFVFEGDQPFASCHASTLVRISNGGFLVAWFGDTAEGSSDVGIWSSIRRERQWSAPRLIAKISDEPHWNPGLARASDGSLRLYFKTGIHPDASRNWLMISRDEGATWEDAQPPGDSSQPPLGPVIETDLPHPNTGLNLAKLDDGVLALVFNPCPPEAPPARSPLAIALSFDNGRTWPRRLDIETGPGEFSYPAIIATRTGMAITYTWNRTRIGFWHGSIEQIPEVAGGKI